MEKAKTVYEKIVMASEMMQTANFSMACADYTSKGNGLLLVTEKPEVKPGALRIATTCAVALGCEEFLLHPLSEIFIVSLFVSYFELGRAYEQVDSLEKLMESEREQK